MKIKNWIYFYRKLLLAYGKKSTMGTDYRSKTSKEEDEDTSYASDSSDDSSVPTDSFHLGKKSGGWKFTLDLIAILHAMSNDSGTPLEQRRKAHVLQDMIRSKKSSWFWRFTTKTTSFQPVYYKNWQGREEYVNCDEVMIPSYLLTKEDLEKFLRRHSYIGDDEYQSLEGEDLDFLFDSDLNNYNELDPHTYVRDKKEFGLSHDNTLIYFMIEGMPNCYAPQYTDFC